MIINKIRIIRTKYSKSTKPRSSDPQIHQYNQQHHPMRNVPMIPIWSTVTSRSSRPRHFQADFWWSPLNGRISQRKWERGQDSRLIKIISIICCLVVWILFDLGQDSYCLVFQPICLNNSFEPSWQWSRMFIIFHGVAQSPDQNWWCQLHHPTWRWQIWKIWRFW